MASPRASRWPPPPLLLPPLLLLLLLPPPAAPEPRGRPPSPACRALLPGAGPERQPPPSSPPRERRGPAPPGPGPAVPAPGSAPRRGRSGRMPRAASAAAVQSHRPESHSTESHLQNNHFHQSQEGPSTVDSRKSATTQTTRTSHTSSETPGNLTVLTESAGAQQMDGTASPARHSPEVPMMLTSQGSTVSSKSLHLPSSSSESDSGISPGSLETMRGLPEEGTVYTQVAGTSASSQFPLHASKPGEPTVFSEKRNSLRPEHSELPFSGTPPHSAPSDHSSPSASITELNNSSALQSPSGSQTKSTHVASTFTNSVPRTVRSLTVSVGPVSEMERFPKDSETDTTSTSVRSSPSVAELRTSSKLTETPGDGDVPEHARENAFGLTSLQWQSDTPTIGGHQLASNPEAGNGSSILQTETVFRSVSSTKSGESTAPWQVTNTEASADVTESSASHPEAVNTTVFSQFSDSAQQPQGGNSGSRERSYSETPSTSSSESLDSSAPLGERSTALEDSLPLSDSSQLPESTSGLRSRSAHTSATLTRSGERTLRSLGSAQATPRGNVTDHAGLLSRSPAAAPALGVTALGYGQANGPDTEPRTPGGHTEHTYVSPTFTKGERALLSITDNHSSSDISESSTSYIKISNSPYLSYSPPSRTHSERSNISDDKYAQSSTESLALHSSSVPSYTSTVHVPDTLVLLGAKTESAGDSSPAGAPVPPPAVSQPQELFSSASPSTRFSTQQLKSTSDAAIPLSSSPSSVSISVMASTLAPHSVSPTTLPQSSSTLVLHRVRETRVTSFQTATIVSVVHSSHTADPKNQSTPHPEKVTTVAKSQSPVSLPTDSTKAVTASSPLWVPLPPALTESPAKPILPTTSTGLVHLSPALTATTSQITQSPVTTPSILSATESLVPGLGALHTTIGKELLPTHPDILVPQVSTESTVTTEGSQAHVVTVTPSIPPTIVPTSAKGSTSRLSNTEEYSPASHFLRTSPQTTDVSTTKALTAKSTTFASQSATQSPAAMSPPTSVSSCAVNPCLHDGECVVDVTGRGYRCVCSPSWQGDNCSEDVNECLSNPCPPLAMCNNTQGSFVCRCPVGYQLEKGICNLVRTFVTEFKLRKPFLNATVENHSELHEFEKEIIHILNMCFSSLPGYIRSTVRTSREPSAVVMFLQTTFSLASNVTLFDLGDGIQKYVNSCRSSAEVCQLLGSQRRVFKDLLQLVPTDQLSLLVTSGSRDLALNSRHCPSERFYIWAALSCSGHCRRKAGSLCKRKSPECDKETSICTDLDGVALCQCKSGYFQFNKMDHSCRACEDGYRLENETCMSCPFGLGGLNCGNPYQLITVVIAAAGGGLLLILGIALIVTCCRKSKNDISKLIFKSGDFQMSPYAEYPKNPRSQEWGRDAIEMHENGSTKNLLQMTDVYCSPSNIRNPELERNGLYPAYTGLPGSRHSCIFPGQYNPSFISDDSRRRDYF